jgi:ACS family allantoate permease-like MFS transporter
MSDSKDMHSSHSGVDAEVGTSYPIDGKAMTGDVDIAAGYADKLEGENAYTTKEWTRLRWKLDMRLVPLLWFNVTLGAMDKVTTATAALYGFRADTGLTGDRYSWVGSAFYVSNPFLSFEIMVMALRFSDP